MTSFEQMQREKLANMIERRDLLTLAIESIKQDLEHPYRSDPVWFRSMCKECEEIARAERERSERLMREKAEKKEVLDAST